MIKRTPNTHPQSRSSLNVSLIYCSRHHDDDEDDYNSRVIFKVIIIMKSKGGEKEKSDWGMGNWAHETAKRKAWIYSKYQRVGSKSVRLVLGSRLSMDWLQQTGTTSTEQLRYWSIWNRAPLLLYCDKVSNSAQTFSVSLCVTFCFHIVLEVKYVVL